MKLGTGNEDGSSREIMKVVDEKKHTITIRLNEEATEKDK